jgi:hypothetical protein
MPRIELVTQEPKMRLLKVKFLLAAAVVAFLALPVSINRSQAGDGAPPPGKTAAPAAADANSLSAGAERELRKRIQKAWREREERVRTLLLLYVMTHKDGPERARWRRDMAELIKKRAAAPAKEAVKDAVKNARPQIIKLAEPYSLQLFAMRDNRLRAERWERPSEKKARALLAGLTLGTDCDVARIEDGDREYILRPKSRGRDGTEFRSIAITLSSEVFNIAPHHAFLLLNYRSGLVTGDWFHFELARVSVVRPNAVPPKGAEPSRVVASFPSCDLWLDPSRDYALTDVVSWRQDRSQEIVRTVCEYEKAPAPLDWVPKKLTTTWLPGTVLAGTVEECVTVDWAIGDDKVPAELFKFDYPDGTSIMDMTEDNGQTTKASIAWHGKLVPVRASRLYSESLERVKKGQLTAPDGK